MKQATEMQVINFEKLYYKGGTIKHQVSGCEQPTKFPDVCKLCGIFVSG